MGLLCDCFGGGSKSSPSQLEQRPRIVEAKRNPPSYSSLPPNISTRSAWRQSRDSDRDHRTISADRTAEDEKCLLQLAIDAEEDEKEDEKEDENEDEDTNNHEPAIEGILEHGSPQSSTISLPSTRFTARTIGTDQTGANSPAMSRQSQESNFTAGAPPSYRPRSGASRYEDESNRSSWVSRHAVLDDAWFDQFGIP